MGRFAAAVSAMLFSPMISENFARAARWSADGRFVVIRSDDNSARVWDAATTEPVTPRFRHSGYIRFACLTAKQRLITASDPNLIRAWDLNETTLPLDVIADYSHLLSGRKLTSSGMLVPLPAAELQNLDRSLRERVPALFASP